MAEQNNAEMESFVYGKALQLVPYFAWLLVAVAAWSIDDQINDFQLQIQKIESTTSNLATAHNSLVASVTEVKATTEQSSRSLEKLDGLSREQSTQLEGVKVIVNELLQIRREERQVRTAK